MKIEAAKYFNTRCKKLFYFVPRGEKPKRFEMCARTVGGILRLWAIEIDRKAKLKAPPSYYQINEQDVPSSFWFETEGNVIAVWQVSHRNDEGRFIPVGHVYMSDLKIDFAPASKNTPNQERLRDARRLNADQKVTQAIMKWRRPGRTSHTR